MVWVYWFLVFKVEGCLVDPVKVGAELEIVVACSIVYEIWVDRVKMVVAFIRFQNDTVVCPSPLQH